MPNKKKIQLPNETPTPAKSASDFIKGSDDEVFEIELKQVGLRLPENVIKEIDKHRKSPKRKVRFSRNSWISLAVAEKLEREGV